MKRLLFATFDVLEWVYTRQYAPSNGIKMQEVKHTIEKNIQYLPHFKYC